MAKYVFLWAILAISIGLAVCSKSIIESKLTEDVKKVEKRQGFDPSFSQGGGFPGQLGGQFGGNFGAMQPGFQRHIFNNNNGGGMLGSTFNNNNGGSGGGDIFNNNNGR